jgi:hypothetical protein
MFATLVQRSTPQIGPIRRSDIGTLGCKTSDLNNRQKAMCPDLRVLAAAMLAAALAYPASSFAQSGDAKPAEKPAAGQPATGQPAEAAKDPQKKVDEFAEAARVVTGPAGHAECVWLGRRVVGLMWRDDLDTAFRHLDLYDRFGCPGPHIQSTFRCVVRQGPIDPKAPQTLNARIHGCWLNHGSSSETAAGMTPPAEAAATTAGSAVGSTGEPQPGSRVR